MAAIGRAAYVFAALEWNVAWCCEKLQPGYLNTITAKKKTAGTVARNFLALAQKAPASAAANCLTYGTEFGRLVEVRNGIMHGKPGTVTPTGEQRLFHSGAPWTIEMLDDAADQFAKCSIAFNDILHNQLP